MKKIMLLLAGFAFSSAVSAANTMYQPGTGGRQQVQPTPIMPVKQAAPAQVLEEGLTGLMDFMRSPAQQGPASIQQFVDTKVSRYFDFPYMAKWVAGSLWRGMNERQKHAFEDKLKQQFVGAMVQRLSKYDDQDIRLIRSRRVSDDAVAVSVALINSRGYPTRIDFRMYPSATGWKIFDVVANGSSALIFYRSQMRQMMRRGSRNTR